LNVEDTRFLQQLSNSTAIKKPTQRANLLIRDAITFIDVSTVRPRVS